MKRVALVVPEFGEEGGGLSLSAYKMRDMLQSDLGLEVMLVDSSAWRNEETIVNGGYDESLTRALTAELALKRIVRRITHDIDAVIAFGGGSNAYFAMLLAECLEVDLIVCNRGTDVNLMHWTRCSELDFCRVYRMARDVVCLSNEQAQKVSWATGIERERIHVIPNVIEPTDSSCFVSRDKGIVLGCGAVHLNEKKGVGLLLEMVRELKSLVGTVRLELIGAVDNDLLANYRSKACRLGVEDNVSFIGLLSRAKFNNRMKSWDLYVQGSICEGFSNAVADAVGMGKGVVLTPTGYIAEFLQKEFPESVFESYDPKQMALQVYNLLGIDELNKRYESAYSRLMCETTRSKVLDLWRSVLEGKPERISSSTSNAGEILAVLFHDIRNDVHDGITVSPAEFDDFVAYVTNLGYRCCSLRNAVEQPFNAGEKRLVMTFDDGYEGVLKYALPSLKKRDFTASVYVCTGTLGLWNNWNFKDKVKRRHLSLDELRRLSLAGWEIGSHGVTHRSVLRLDENELIDELDVSKRILEAAFGRVTSYAYPYGDYNTFVRSQVAARYDYGMTMNQGGVYLLADRHSIRRYMASEILRILTGK